MKLEDKIKNHAATNYSSSPHTFSDEEIKVLINSDCACDNCGVDIFELDDFPIIENGQVYCEDCEKEKFYTICPICEESFRKAQEAQDMVIVINKELAQSQEIKPGIYKVLRYPIYRACLVFGFESLYTENIEIVRALDIEKMESEIRFKTGWNKKDAKTEILSGEICKDCFDKFTLKKRYFTHWCSDKKVHWNINERGVLNSFRV